MTDADILPVIPENQRKKTKGLCARFEDSQLLVLRSGTRVADFRKGQRHASGDPLLLMRDYFLH